MESAETICAGSMSAISSATALLPEPVGPNSASTNGTSGGDECLLCPAERRRGRSGDRDRHQIAGVGAPVEVHRRVPASPSAKQSRVGPAGSLDEHLFRA